MLDLRDIRKSFMLGPVMVEVLKGVSLKVEAGELMSIVGSSGCGKSTLMNILGFLDVPSSGEYLFEGRDTAGMNDDELSAIRNQKVGFVFQQFNLLPRLTALQNVCLPLIYRGIAERQRHEMGREVLVQVGMAERMEHRPTELSGGQQQRVAIARAIAGGPSLLLADEPTGALDTQTSDEVTELFFKLNEKNHLTTVIITHDPALAKKCKRMVRMRDGVMAAG